MCGGGLLRMWSCRSSKRRRAHERRGWVAKVVVVVVVAQGPFSSPLGSAEATRPCPWVCAVPPRGEKTIMGALGPQLQAGHSFCQPRWLFLWLCHQPAVVARWCGGRGGPASTAAVTSSIHTSTTTILRRLILSSTRAPAHSTQMRHPRIVNKLRDEFREQYGEVRIVEMTC